MAPKRSNRRSKRAQVPQKDVIMGWANLRMNYGGAAQSGFTCFAHEFPLGLMNCQTDLSVVWSNVKRYQLSHVSVRLLVPKKTQGEIFLGWNKTPTALSQKTVTGADGYHNYLRRCDMLRVSNSAEGTTLSMTIPCRGWRSYISVPSYVKYSDLLDRDLLRYCYGSLIIGITVPGGGGNLAASEIAELIQIRAVQHTQGSAALPASAALDKPARESSTSDEVLGTRSQDW